MKPIFKILSILFLSAITFTSCRNEDGTEPEEETSQTELKLYAIDTAKVLKMNADGSGESIVLNKKVNLNSYIGGLSIKPSGTKFIFDEHQMSSGVFQKKVIVANIDGTSEKTIFNTGSSNEDINYVKYCSDGKVMIWTVNYSTSTKTLHTMNEDGTGDVIKNFPYNFHDISDNREYMVNVIGTSVGNMKVVILDIDGDAGYPGGPNSFNISVPTAEEIWEPKFTSDNKYVIAPYKVGNEIKAIVIEIATKATKNFTLVSGLSSGWLSYNLHLSPNKPFGVLTLTGDGYSKSKSYVIDVEKEKISVTFDNNDENIFDVYPN